MKTNVAPPAAGAPPASAAAGSGLWNPDLAPTDQAHRTWNRWHFAALWVGMSVCVPTYMLAANLLKIGMTWWQAIGTIALGNLIVLVPMVLNGHPGTRYGIPFPVLVRASFGTRGSNIPAIARGIVACGWFGIQTWIGGLAIYQIGLLYWPHWAALPDLPAIGINQIELLCFFAFWLLNVWFIVRGTESIKWLETLSAPFLILIGVALLAWGISKGGSLGNVLAQSEAFARPTLYVTEGGPEGRAVVKVDSYRPVTRVRIGDGEWRPLDPEGIPASDVPPGAKIQLGDDAGHTTSALAPAPRAAGGGGRAAGFWLVFFPALTAMVGYWATLSLNIPDFTRFAKSQRDQLLGQLYGLPTTMAFYSFIGIAVTCAALLAFPDVLAAEDAPWDPVSLLGRFRAPALCSWPRSPPTSPPTSSRRRTISATSLRAGSASARAGSSRPPSASS